MVSNNTIGESHGFGVSMAFEKAINCLEAIALITKGKVNDAQLGKNGFVISLAICMNEKTYKKVARTHNAIKKAGDLDSTACTYPAIKRLAGAP